MYSDPASVIIETEKGLQGSKRTSCYGTSRLVEGGKQMGSHHFWGGGMCLFPIIMIILCVVMLKGRRLMLGQGGFRASRQDSRTSGRHHLVFEQSDCGLPSHFANVFFGVDGEQPLYAPPTAPSEVHSRPAQPSRTTGHLTSPTLQAHLEKARAYQAQINSLLKSTSNQSARARLQDLATQVSKWTRTIENMAKGIDSFQQDTLIHQDLESVPQAIEQLEALLANESDDVTRLELERTLVNRKNQLAALEQLQSTIKRAEIKMESTLSALGTIYSQLLTAQSTNHVADYSRLLAEVDEEVRTLQDHLEALEEVKLGRVEHHQPPPARFGNEQTNSRARYVPAVA